MEESENDAVLSALQAIVDQYGGEIKDLAVDMVGALLKAFGGYAGQGGEDDEAAFSASQCLDTIGAVLEAVQDEADTMVQLEALVMPLLHQIVNSGTECYEYLDNAIGMMSYFTYYSEGISAVVWTLCGPFLKVMRGWGYDYMTELMVPILNYISKDVTTFLGGSYEGTPFVTMLLGVVEKCFTEDTSESEREAKAAATLLTSLLSCAKCSPVLADHTSLDGVLPPILHLISTRLPICSTTLLRIKVLECGMACTYYNPQLTLNTFAVDAAAVAAGGAFFTTLFDTFQKMEEDGTQRLIVLSISALLSLPSTSLPAPVVGNLQAVFMQCIRELVMIEEEAEKGEDESEDGDEDEDEEDDDDDGMEDEDDDEEDEDEEEEDSKGKGKGTKGGKGGKGSATFRALKDLAVPEGGYGEDEDCANVEDEEYRAVLERMEKEEEGKRTRYVEGQAYVDGEVSGCEG